MPNNQAENREAQHQEPARLENIFDLTSNIADAEVFAYPSRTEFAREFPRVKYLLEQAETREEAKFMFDRLAPVIVQFMRKHDFGLREIERKNFDFEQKTS